MWQEQCTQTLIGKHPVHGSDGGGSATSRGFRGAEPGQEKGGHPGGFLRLRAGGGGYRTAGCHVPRSIPRAGEREEEAAVGDRSHADLGLSGSGQAAHQCSDPSSSPAAPRGRPLKI